MGGDYLEKQKPQFSNQDCVCLDQYMQLTAAGSFQFQCLIWLELDIDDESFMQILEPVVKGNGCTAQIKLKEQQNSDMVSILRN
eukprot:scaffold41487_cov100-Cyclotella_meneghiniana.AAC.1